MRVWLKISGRTLQRGTVPIMGRCFAGGVSGIGCKKGGVLGGNVEAIWVFILTTFSQHLILMRNVCRRLLRWPKGMTSDSTWAVRV